MSKIKKVDEVTDLSVYTKFTKDEGIFQIDCKRIQHGVQKFLE